MKEMFIDDPFGNNRWLAHSIVEHLIEESWTPERKDEIIRRMKEKQAELIEHVQFADYDLALWHYTNSGFYAVSLNSGQEDPTDIAGQKRQPKAQALPWLNVVTQLRQWVRQYGKLLIGSAIDAKTNQYRRLLYRHFLIGDWKEYPEHGFFILPD